MVERWRGETQTVTVYAVALWFVVPNPNPKPQTKTSSRHARPSSSDRRARSRSRSRSRPRPPPSPHPAPAPGNAGCGKRAGSRPRDPTRRTRPPRPAPPPRGAPAPGRPRYRRPPPPGRGTWDDISRPETHGSWSHVRPVTSCQGCGVGHTARFQATHEATVPTRSKLKRNLTAHECRTKHTRCRMHHLEARGSSVEDSRNQRIRRQTLI